MGIMVYSLLGVMLRISIINRSIAILYIVSLLQSSIPGKGKIALTICPKPIP